MDLALQKLGSALKSKQELLEELVEMRRQAAYWHSIVANTPVFICLVDRAGTIQYLNRTVPGIAMEDAIGRSTFEFLKPDYWQITRECIEQVFDTGQTAFYEAVSAGPNGGSSWYETSLGPVKAGDQVVAVTLIATDITERKRVEEALRKAHDEQDQQVRERTAELSKANEALDIFRRFAEESKEGFGMSDFDGRITYANPALCRMFGEATPDDVIGKNVFTYYSAEYRQRRKDEVIPALLRDGHWQIEQTVSPRHGKPIQTLQSTFLIRDRNGNPFRIAVVISDLTERKRAEEALRQSRDELQAVYDGMPDGLLITDLEGMQFVRVNAAICQMLGYTETELRSLSVSDIHPAEAVPFILERIRATGEAGQLPAGSIPFLRKNGSVFYAEAIGRSLTYHGRPCSMGIFRDITERKRVEDALRTSEEKYRSVVETFPDAIVMSDLEGRVLFASTQAWELLGLAGADELLGRCVFDYVIAADRQRLAANMAQLVESGVRRGTKYTALRPDGTTFPTEVASAVIPDAAGQPKAVMAVIRDITERQRAAEALRQSDERYELAVRGAGVGLWDWDIRTGKLYYSSRWKMLFGYDENEIGDSLEDWVRLLHPDEREQILKLQEDFLAGTSSTIAIEYRLRHKDGSYRWIAAHGLAVRDEQGRAYRFVGSHGDITDRKRAEEALRRSEEQLAERTVLAEWRAFQLQRLAAALTEAEEGERRRLSQVLHDHLQQILVGARLHLDTVQDMTQDDRLAAGLKKTQSLLSEAIEASRSLTAELSPPILYDQGLVAALEWLCYQAQEKFRLTTSVEADPRADLKGEGIGSFVYQAARELILNAAKHGHATAVAIRLSHMDDDYIRLAVTDDGAGCEPERLTPRGDAGGFGLFSIRERLDLIGGSLEITSTPGQGTQATIIAPCKAAPSRRSRPVSDRLDAPDRLPAKDGTRIRVLLVDDHPIYLKGLADLLLEQPNIDLVGEAGDGQAAVEMALRLRPDVIVMDVSMPRMDGIEATRRIKDAMPGIRIIGLSMHETGDLEISMRDAGADAYLPKTAAADDLLAAIMNRV